ncbi:leucine-rich_repeat domain-containing protein [Hexamita inflata]|uniref:Leucine-rich repeat domain-containing protein n=1 Tax=Hexamita inflata TaxID=28002 RepID=A0AA86PSN8_9EUKA|nr:leucine-rich repeat domain-containing protein [Hexamita inflata]
MLDSNKQPCGENKNNDTSNHSKEPQMLSEFDKTTIKMYQSQIKDETLVINFDSKLTSLDFVKYLQINKLTLTSCKNIIPKLYSQTLKSLQIMNCGIQSLKDFQIENLYTLVIYNISNILESKELFQEILRFQKLTNLALYQWITDFSPLSQMTRLTTLRLNNCELRSTEVLRSLDNLVELHMFDNKNIDITSLQYLTNLMVLNLESCNLISLDAIRPLTKLIYFNISSNLVVYLQPIMDLKQISGLCAINNKIIDSESIKQHQYCQYFDLRNQKQPTTELLKTASTLRSINTPISFLKLMLKQYINLKSKKLKITEYLQKYSQSITQIEFLLQQINMIECCQ